MIYRTYIKNTLTVLSVILVCFGLYYVYVFNKNIQQIEIAIGIKQTKVKIKDTEFVATVADTPELRQKGLGGRSSIQKNEGMLFEFADERPYAFWMKDMIFPIDIIWIDSSNKIVDLVSGADPNSFPHVFVPRKNARKVLEIQSGITDELNIQIGEKILTVDGY